MKLKSKELFPVNERMDKHQLMRLHFMEVDWNTPGGGLGGGTQKFPLTMEEMVRKLMLYHEALELLEEGIEDGLRIGDIASIPLKNLFVDS